MCIPIGFDPHAIIAILPKEHGLTGQQGKIVESQSQGTIAHVLHWHPFYQKTLDTPMLCRSVKDLINSPQSKRYRMQISKLYGIHRRALLRINLT